MLLAEQDRGAGTRSRSSAQTATSAGRPRSAGPGTFQLQAAIAACHAGATTWAETDWLQILTLYDMLMRIDRSPVVRLNHAIALSHVSGPAPALAEIDAVAPRLETYHLFHATRAHLLDQLGRPEEAALENGKALALAANPVEQDLLRARLERDDVDVALDSARAPALTTRRGVDASP